MPSEYSVRDSDFSNPDIGTPTQNGLLRSTLERQDQREEGAIYKYGTLKRDRPILEHPVFILLENLMAWS